MSQATIHFEGLYCCLLLCYLDLHLFHSTVCSVCCCITLKISKSSENVHKQPEVSTVQFREFLELCHQIFFFFAFSFVIFLV